MAGKSRRGKRLSRSKRKGRKVFSAPAALKPVAGEVNEPAPDTRKPAPLTKAKPRAPVAVVQASDVAAELRRIGIVAGIIVVILVILALIFA